MRKNDRVSSYKSSYDSFDSNTFSNNFGNIAQSPNRQRVTTLLNRNLSCDSDTPVHGSISYPIKVSYSPMISRSAALPNASSDILSGLTSECSGSQSGFNSPIQHEESFLISGLHKSLIHDIHNRVNISSVISSIQYITNIDYLDKFSLLEESLLLICIYCIVSERYKVEELHEFITLMTLKYGSSTLNIIKCNVKASIYNIFKRKSDEVIADKYEDLLDDVCEYADLEKDSLTFSNTLLYEVSKELNFI